MRLCRARCPFLALERDLQSNHDKVVAERRHVTGSLDLAVDEPLGNRSQRMQIATILVGIDFSPESQIGLEHALHLARHCGSRLALVYAGAMPDPRPPIHDTGAVGLDLYHRVFQANLDEDRARMSELYQRIIDQGIEASQTFIDEFPDVGICRLAEEVDAGLVVVGSHGRTGIKRLLLGSVAERVIRLCGRSVLVARQSPAQSPDEHTDSKAGDSKAGEFRNILVATDFSPIAEQALRSAIGIAAPDARIDLCHCWYLPPIYQTRLTMSESVSDLSQPLAKYTERLGQEWAERYRRPGIDLTFHNLNSPPTEGILHTLEQGNYDLVVTGSHGRRGLRRFLLGSVAEVIVRHSPVSVLVVHGSGAEQTMESDK